MYYFDNSATTKPKKEVLDIFNKYAFDVAKPADLENEKNNIRSLLNCNHDIIYTSGSSESNNLAIKGIAYKYINSNKHIISTKTEHSSVIETLNYLETKGFIIDYVNLNEGIVDTKALEELISKDTILITISAVNSETGIIGPVQKISEIAKKYNITFHCDMTQSIGKIDIPINNIDLVSISAHKIHGLKGIGCLLKKDSIDLEPLFIGERNYNLGLIKSFTKSLSISEENIEYKYNNMLKKKEYFLNKISKIPKIHVNSNDNCIPYIINISFKGVKPETMLHKLEEYDIYISTKSACSKGGMSDAVYYLTNNKEYASTSIRLSLPYNINYKDINILAESIINCYNYFKK